MQFNKQQLESINTIEGNVQVIANAGAGKSSSLVERINNMITNHNISSNEVLAISFTNASAADLKSKLNEKNIDITVGTFHSICRQLLQEYDEDKYKDILNLPNKYQLKREMELKTKEKNLNIDDILNWIGYQKAYNLTSTANFVYKESIYEESQLRIFYRIYEDFCAKRNQLDFDSWMIEVHKLYKSEKIVRKWKYVLCDEAQDLNTIQYLLLDDFCDENNKFVIGDFFQSVYSFRGSEPELFKNFDKKYKNVKIINMNINYRSANNIVEAANNFVRKYAKDYANYKDAEAFNKENGNIECKSYSTAESEAYNVANKIEELHKQGIELKDMAVIYRNNAMADYIENELKKRKIEYQISSNGSFYDRKEIKGILSIMKLIVDSTDDEAFETVLSTRFYPCTYFQGSLIDNLRVDAGRKNCSLYEAFVDYKWGKEWEHKNAIMFVDFINRLKVQKEKRLSNDKIIDNIVKMFKVYEWIKEKIVATAIQDKLDGIQNLKNISMNTSLEGFLKFCNNGGVVKTKKNEEGVTLQSIHKSKGLEYKIVFLIGLQDNKFPSNKSSIESEARLMYVACTRSKEQFYVSCIEHSDFYDEYKKYFKE